MSATTILLVAVATATISPTAPPTEAPAPASPFCWRDVVGRECLVSAVSEAGVYVRVPLSSTEPREQRIERAVLIGDLGAMVNLSWRLRAGGTVTVRVFDTVSVGATARLRYWYTNDWVLDAGVTGAAGNTARATGSYKWDVIEGSVHAGLSFADWAGIVGHLEVRAADRTAVSALFGVRLQGYLGLPAVILTAIAYGAVAAAFGSYSLF